MILCLVPAGTRTAKPDRWHPSAIENRFAGPFLHAKELVELMDFRPDLFLGLQRHDDELTVLCRVKHAAKLVILDGEMLDVVHKTFHVTCSADSKRHKGKGPVEAGPMIFLAQSLPSRTKISTIINIVPSPPPP